VDCSTINTIELCAGVGMLGEGLAAGLRHMGVNSRCILYAEREAYPCAVLEARMEEGSLDAAPIWCGDFRELPASEFLGVVDCIAAGFPCQDLSLAGKRAGLDGARSGLFFDILDIADACGAQYLFLENVAGIASATATAVDEAEGALEERAAARVLGELADRGWDAEWLTLSASDVGASHGRARWFCWAWRSLDDAGRVQRSAGHEQDRPGIAEASRHEARDGIANRGFELGSTRLQHQHLQQREDGVEHSGADRAMGHTDQQRTHRSGPPGQQAGCAESAITGGCVADAMGNGWHQGRTESGGEQGRSDVAECGSPLDDAFSIGRDARRMLDGEHERNVADAASTINLANTSSPRQQGTELGRARDGHRGGGRKHMNQLANFVGFSPLVQQISDGPESLPASPGSALHSVLKGSTTPRLLTKRLNPYFGERLMGWPTGWTSATAPSASSASATELWRSRLQQHLSCLLDEQDL